MSYQPIRKMETTWNRYKWLKKKAEQNILTNYLSSGMLTVHQVLRKIPTDTKMVVTRASSAANSPLLSPRRSPRKKSTSAAAKANEDHHLNEKKKHKLHQIKKRVRHRTVKDGKTMYFGKYVSHEGSANLLTYEYHGVDNSLVYKHVLTPMNNYLVNLFPVWLAPNLVSTT